MPNRIDQCFQRLAAANQKGFIAYITAGDPDLPRSMEIAEAIAKAGADLIEIGIPFSDPLADGPTIQAAAQRALAAGTTLDHVLTGISSLRQRIDSPIVLFTYLNPIYVYGFEAFHRDAAQAGADGILILDLPPEEASLSAEFSAKHGLYSIQLIAPTTPEARIKEVASRAEGFIYYVSREGVTGEQSQIAQGISQQVSIIRRHTELPIAVGFGISNPEQAAAVAAQADAAVVGSAIVRQIAEHASAKDLPTHIFNYVKPLADAIH